MDRKFVHGNQVVFVSLGCSRNLVDTEVMVGILLKAGYEIAQATEDADYLVVNTCGFLESARQESCDTIADLFAAKKPSAKVIVAGCMVQKHSAEIKEKFPKVHYLLGSGDMEKILEAVETEEQGDAVSSARSYLEWGEVPRQLSTPKNFAYLKIAEGCAKRCSFCIIPTIKGPLRSKPLEQVKKEFMTLLDRGVHEVILIAQDLGDYGKERKEKQGLEALVQELLMIEKPFWLRFLYLYPDEISEELIELIASDKRICPYLDMPIQHINNGILKAMRRKTSKEQIIETIQKLRNRLPHVVIRTSLMVGFPGETEEQFQELLQFIHDYPLDNIGIFKYSREEESFSASLPNHIAEEIKQDRFERLAAAQQKLVEKNNKKFVGKTLEVVVEGYHPETKLLMRGRFYGQCPDIDGQVLLNEGLEKIKSFNELYEVKITGISGYDLIGSVKKSCKVNVTPKSNKLALAS
jgi:ribosomal protein S12 methylthiotransferase